MQMSVFDRHPIVTLCAIVISMLMPLDLVAGHFLIERIPGEYSSIYHHGLKKNFNGMTSWGPIRIQMFTNALGFKDRTTRAVALKPDRRRIVFIGDSFTEGVGVPYDQTFVGRIDSAVDSGSCEVLNSGFKSGTPKLYVLRLKQLVESGFRFHELNLFVDISDIKDEVVLRDFEPHQPTTRERLDGVSRALSDTSILFKYVIRPLIARVGRALGHSSVVDDAVPPQMDADKSKWTYDDAVYRDWGARGLALAGEHALELASLCRSIGAGMSIAVYPWPDQIEHGDLDSRQVRFWQDLCEREHLLFVNYFPVFMANRQASETIREYFIPGDIHWNPAGHSLVADTWMKTSASASLTGRCAARPISAEPGARKISARAN
jgi:hypothetical protein